MKGSTLSTPSAPQLPQVPGAPARAREQAETYDSVFAPALLDLDEGGSIEIPPHPNLRMLDDDRQAEYEELLFETESYDREDDVYIPEQRLRDATGNETGVVLPAQTRRGELKLPFRQGGVLVKPPHTVRVVQVALGEKEYARLRAGGKSAADVWRVWNDQGLRIADRQVVDSKSDGSSSTVAPLPR